MEGTGEARASQSSWGNLKASMGLADGDVHQADLRTSMADGRTKWCNLLTSTSFFFLVMLFFWSFSGWGAALLTGGLEQRVSKRSKVLNKRQQGCLSSVAS